MYLTLKSSRPELFCKKGVLRNLTKFTAKHLRQSLFFNRPATLLKKRLWHRCFHVNFVKFLRTPFHTEHLWWLLLFRAKLFQKMLLLCGWLNNKINVQAKQNKTTLVRFETKKCVQKETLFFSRRQSNAQKTH